MPTSNKHLNEQSCSYVSIIYATSSMGLLHCVYFWCDICFHSSISGAQGQLLHLSLQVVTTLAAVAYVAMALTGVGGPAAVVLGGGLALSSTAVAMQVLQDRNETGSRHGRAAFAVLLLQVSPQQINTSSMKGQAVR